MRDETTPGEVDEKLTALGLHITTQGTEKHTTLVSQTRAIVRYVGWGIACIKHDSVASTSGLESVDGRGSEGGSCRGVLLKLRRRGA